MYKLYILNSFSDFAYMCHSTRNPRQGQVGSSLDFVLNTDNFAYGADPWDKWVTLHVILQIITFDSVEQFKLDYPELFI